tara:strand:- start:786 stop:968 length:183 start_codon:yes stop_codon:yes gene_type:complete
MFDMGFVIAKNPVNTVIEKVIKLSICHENIYQNSLWKLFPYIFLKMQNYLNFVTWNSALL